MVRKIGVLALQGDFEKHKIALKQSGAEAKEVRMPQQLKGCDGLVIPGGESTVLTRLMNLYNFYDPIKIFAKNFPVMGTCAGLIMLSNKVDDDRVKPLKLIDITVDRNGYGSQVDSFVASVEFKGLQGNFDSYFIRAPKVKMVGENVNVLSKYADLPIAMCSENILVMSFHPELGGDVRIHKFFIKDY
jgi:pyridoxal 5'-phosphate synthase pdxT subunit